MGPAPANALSIIPLKTGAYVVTDIHHESEENNLGVTSSQVQELVEINKALREMVITVAGLLKDSRSISSFLGRRDYGLFWTG